MGIKSLAQFVGNSKKINTKPLQVRGFSAWPPKEPHALGFVIYYDGMEGGTERATNYMNDLINTGYKITDKVKANDTNIG